MTAAMTTASGVWRGDRRDRQERPNGRIAARWGHVTLVGATEKADSSKKWACRGPPARRERATDGQPDPADKGRPVKAYRDSAVFRLRPLLPLPPSGGPL